MVTFTQVLCPTDLSEASRPSLSYAAAVARRYGAVLTLLHVLPPFEPLVVPSLAFKRTSTSWMASEVCASVAHGNTSQQRQTRISVTRRDFLFRIDPFISLLNI